MQGEVTRLLLGPSSGWSEAQMPQPRESPLLCRALARHPAGTRGRSSVLILSWSQGQACRRRAAEFFLVISEAQLALPGVLSS